MIGIYSLLFFFSGLSALVYQVTWQRLTAYLVGSDALSATIIVGIFMLGLGLGSILGGKLSDTLSTHSRTKMFAGVEVMLALFGFASSWWLYEVLYLSWIHLNLPSFFIYLILTLSLLIPTVLMGMTLPLLGTIIVFNVSSAPSRLGLLYAFNTLGSAGGALLTVIFLVRNYGFDGATYIAAALNLMVGIGVLLVSKQKQSSVGLTIDTTRTRGTEPTISRSRIIYFYALSGFIGLSLELVWFRLLGVSLKSNSFTFGFLLFFYLSGLGIGGLLGWALIERIKRPFSVFRIVQATVAAYGLCSVVTLYFLANPQGVLSPLYLYFSSYDPLRMVFSLHDVTLTFLVLYLVIPFLLVTIPTGLMGASFVLIQRSYNHSLDELGKGISYIQIANIFGSFLGVVVTGKLLLGYCGTFYSLVFIAMLGLYFIWDVVKFQWIIVGVLFILFPLVTIDHQSFWGRFHGTERQSIVVKEDHTGVSAIRGEAPGRFLPNKVYVNGLGQSWMPFGSIHSLLGVMPALFHPNPSDIAVIGIGSGDTPYAVAIRPETQRIEVIEIVYSLFDLLQENQNILGYPPISLLFSDQRFRFVKGDGRAVLLQDRSQFDIIEADALRPDSAFAGNLYSKEYFSLLLSRLKPGGYAVTWAPTPRTAKTFKSVFKHTLEVGGVLLGSATSFSINKQSVALRAVDSFTQERLRLAGIDIDAFIKNAFKYSDTLESQMTSEELDISDLNTDLHPLDEFRR